MHRIIPRLGSVPVIRCVVGNCFIVYVNMSFSKGREQAPGFFTAGSQGGNNLLLACRAAFAMHKSF